MNTYKHTDFWMQNPIYGSHVSKLCVTFFYLMRIFSYYKTKPFLSDEGDQVIYRFMVLFKMCPNTS